VCDIPGDECDDQGGVQGDKIVARGRVIGAGKRCQPSGMKTWTTNEKMNLGKE
jgi:hypothetical protein